MPNSTHTRLGALHAIRDNVNILRNATLAQSRADYISEHGPWPEAYENENGEFYPNSAPSLPEMGIDDPTDFRRIDGKIYRRLTLFSAPVRPLQYVGGNSGGEPEHSASLEWSVVSSPTNREDMEREFAAGLAELDAALSPLTQTGLTRPDTQESVAISFEMTGADFQVHDIGDNILKACIIDISFTLFANSILT